MAMETSFIEVAQAPSIGLVEALELFGGAAVADELMARQQLGLYAARDQALGHLAAQHVDDHGSGDGGDWAGAPLEAIDFEDAIARRAVIVDDNIGDVGEFLA